MNEKLPLWEAMESGCRANKVFHSFTKPVSGSFHVRGLTEFFFQIFFPLFCASNNMTFSVMDSDS